MPMFPEYIIQEVTEKNDIHDVVSKYVHLKKAGNSYVGLCPFHNEKTPSFSVSPQRGVFHCFGCGVGGDVISFLMKIENIPFYEAVKKLADMSGITLPQVTEYDKGNSEKIKKQKEKLFELNREAALFFYENLKDSQKSIEYLKKRQLTGALAKTFWLGFAPDSWNSLFDYLRGKGYTESDIFNAGLIKRHESGRYYDMFRNRLMFPIFDAGGNIIAFGGRVFDDSKPKYLNSPESAIFSKSKNLYGINIAKNSKKDFVLLTEGYMDTIALMKNGFLNTVATLGTALTAVQAKYLANNFKEIVICYDGDKAGHLARLRAISMLREHDVKITVIDLGSSKDPDEFINTNGVERFKVALSNRKHDMEYLMDYYADGFDLKNPQDIVSYVQEVIEYLKLIRSSVEQNVYVNMLSGRTKVSEKAIYAQLGITQAKQGTGSDLKVSDPMVIALRKRNKTNKTVLDNAREHLLSLIIFDKIVYNKHKDSITDKIFELDFHISLLNSIRQSYEESGHVVASRLTSHFADNETDLALLSRILSLDDFGDNTEKAYEDYMKIISSEIKKNEIKALMNSGDDLDKLNEMLKNKR